MCILCCDVSLEVNNTNIYPAKELSMCCVCMCMCMCVCVCVCVCVCA